MATKKEKRARMAEKRARFEEEVRISGLEALKKERARRFEKELEAWEKSHTEKHSWRKRIKECPHCRIEINAAKKMSKENEDVA